MEAGLAGLVLRQLGNNRDFAVLLFAEQKSPCLGYNMDKLAGRIAEISLERGEISLTRKKLFLVSRMKVQKTPLRVISYNCQM